MQVQCDQMVLELNKLFLRTVGDLQRVLHQAVPPERAGAGCLVFAADETMLREALAGGAEAIVVPLKLEGCIPEGTTTAILLTKNLKLTMAQVLQRYFDDSREKFCQDPAIDPRAFVSPEAVIGVGATVAAGAFVGPRAVIGPGARIGPGCVVEEDARVGAETVLHALVFVGRRCEVGARCEIHPHTTIGSDGYAYAQDEHQHHHKVPQLGIVVVEDDVEIQSNCAIDRAAFDVTRIRQGTKIDNLCHIAHNCQIGEHVLLTGGFFAAGSSTVGNHCATGGRATLTDHVHVCDGVQLGGLCAVTKDVTEPGVYSGYPLQPMSKFLRTTSTLVHLPEMRKRLLALEKKVLEGTARAGGGQTGS